MFIKQDWFMRQIEVLAAAIAQLIFGRGEVLHEIREESRDTSGALLEREPMALLKRGRLCEGEDALFRTLDLSDREDLLFATEFYWEANRLSDEELAVQDFTREELWDGLREVMALYGVEIPGF
jgi:hypothetical protein